MDDRLLLDKMDLGKGTVCIEGQEYDLNDTYFPTIDFKQPYVLSEEEQKVMEDLRERPRSASAAPVTRKYMKYSSMWRTVCTLPRGDVGGYLKR